VSESARGSSVLPRSCSVCSSRNPSKTLQERDLGRKRYATLREDCGDDRYSENTLSCSASTVLHRAYAVSAVDAGCSSSLTGQLADAATLALVFCSTVDRVSALLIRRSLVRAQVGEPSKPCQFTVDAPQPTVSETRCGCICRRIQLADADCAVQTLCFCTHCTQQRGEAQG
jgi:hypothetical protein